MRRSFVAMGLIGVLAGNVVLASLVEARVGGGGSSGSRGSRSYSAPRVPSSPITPSSPTSPQRPAAPGTPGSLTQPARPGMFGGFGGMLGGFLLGGLLGSLLFGGLGGFGGGIGLMDLLVMGGLAALVISFLRRRASGPVPATASGPAFGRPEVAPAEDRAAATPGAVRLEPGAPSAADEDLAAGLEHVRAMDPGFDPARFLGLAKDLFIRLQIGWSGGDLAAVRAHLTDEMAAALEADMARLRERGRRNRVEGVTVDSIALTEAWQEYGRDLVTAEIRAAGTDYVVDEATGQVVEGSASKPTSFVEYWTFVRPVGANPWRLGAIQQPSA
jgi:predicted lipid-binding transport protein (Tim44 family)